VPRYRAAGFDPYISGYSGGQQRRWLERELAAARQDDDIDWIVVFMHQVALSSAHFNGADLGIRRQWLPLFDRYGVDLVLSGHEHHFERSHPVRGVLSGSDLLTPAAASRRTGPADIDTRYGTVHMTIGGGGHPYRVPGRRLHDADEGVVVAEVQAGNPLVQRKSVLQTEPNLWSAYQDTSSAFGFASFDVAPAERSGTTSITATYWGAADGSPAYRPRDRIVLRKPTRTAERCDDRLAVSRQAN
jgi:calcineurin-like phosphoesterase family protein